MFPNPQSALPLPPRPSIERYRKLAKELVKACKSSDSDTLQAWAERWVVSLVQLSGIVLTTQLPVRVASWIVEVEAFARRHLSPASPARDCSLTAAQFVIARSHGFASWPRFLAHLEALESTSSTVSRFELAADAVIEGDLSKLKRLVSEWPQVIRTRSAREHAATLLHYVSANGVEGYRQRTPSNIVEIADYLLGAGAEVDAVAHVYGGECTTLLLAATSVHPEHAGVQRQLLSLLLDRGASLEPPIGNGQSLVAACLANGRLAAAQFLAERGSSVSMPEAAALGDVRAVQTYLTRNRNVVNSETREPIDRALLNACGHGRVAIAKLLIDHGATLSFADGNGQTALHCAVIGGHLEMVRMLLEHRPPLEAINLYGGTPLGQAMWSAAHGGDTVVFLAIFLALQGAGAKIPQKHVPVNSEIDAWLEQQGSRAEPTWRWYGK